MGSGWGALVWEPIGGRLLRRQIYDHQSQHRQGGVPLLVMDAWEHAYYLQYKNREGRVLRGGLEPGGTGTTSRNGLWRSASSTSPSPALSSDRYAITPVIA